MKTSAVVSVEFALAVVVPIIVIVICSPSFEYCVKVFNSKVTVVVTPLIIVTTPVVTGLFIPRLPMPSKCYETYLQSGSKSELTFAKKEGTVEITHQAKT